MHVASLHIRNFRCFKDSTVDFNPGVNVIIGENNAGKTSLLKALGLIFDRDSRSRFGRYDFYQGLEPSSNPPEIAITAILRSSKGDTLADKALVATWLTKLEAPWEATLSFRYFLPEEEVPDFQTAVGTAPDKERFWRELERYLPRYVSRVYGGNPDSCVVAEPEWLNRFDCQLLDAIRDVESRLFSGSNPMLRAMLNQVLDLRVAADDRKTKQEQFGGAARELCKELRERLDVNTLFELVKDTGAEDAGKPDLAGTIEEADVIGALKLFISRTGLTIPATHNGLGYNNLLYISLVLASLDLEQSTGETGPHAVLFPILLIEEPEAHLHPALQYKLLKYLQKRIGKEKQSRQILFTTHSTHITAAVDLDSIICMSAGDQGSPVCVSYPGRVFSHGPDGRRSKKYVERFLDATKSNMLFAKGVIFVEGLTEQLLLPCFAEYMGLSLEDKHVAVIAVGGSTFKHCLPIFGAGVAEDRKQCALRRPVACIVDADPMRKKEDEAKWTRCLPCQLTFDSGNYEFKPKSGVVENLVQLCQGNRQIRIEYGLNTFEYDLAHANSSTPILITAACTHADDLRHFARSGDGEYPTLESCLKDDEPQALGTIADAAQRRRARFASYYLRCTEERKGENAFDLARRMRRILDHRKSRCIGLQIPNHIRGAIRWACREHAPTPDGTS
jgi:putative ATP-dependent endonuclease of OLD family